MIGAGRHKGGDLMSRLIDLTGQKFGRLKVIGRAENAKNGKARWICQCKCGEITISTGVDLRRGHTNSCKCMRIERIKKANTTHGDTDTRIYNIWKCIKARTINPNASTYSDYGGRGISICKEWENDFQKFKKWALENGYSDDLTIDRINNEEGYSPNNCRWVNKKVQGNNKRNNHTITYNGETKTLTEWAEHIGISRGGLKERLNKLGWSIEKALTTPPHKSK
jgi:hypothetical protein